MFHDKTQLDQLESYQEEIRAKKHIDFTVAVVCDPIKNRVASGHLLKLKNYFTYLTSSFFAKLTLLPEDRLDFFDLLLHGRVNNCD